MSMSSVDFHRGFLDLCRRNGDYRTAGLLAREKRREARRLASLQHKPAATIALYTAIAEYAAAVAAEIKSRLDGNVDSLVIERNESEQAWRRLLTAAETR
jgi:hypothetical protein